VLRRWETPEKYGYCYMKGYNSSDCTGIHDFETRINMLGIRISQSSQIMLPTTPRRSTRPIRRRSTGTRRHTDTHARSCSTTRRPHCPFIDATFGYADRRQHPVATAAPHALPRILADIGVAFGTLEATVEFALFELGAHPRQGFEEVVRAGG